MKITIECNKAEQANFIDNIEESEDCCLFHGIDDMHCNLNESCHECLLKNIEWKIDNARVCYSCGRDETPVNLLVIHNLPYSNADVLLCGACLAKLITEGKRVERGFGGSVVND